MIYRLGIALATVALLAGCASSLKDTQPATPSAARHETPPSSEAAGASRGKAAPRPAAAANSPACPEGSTWNGERCAGSAVLTHESTSDDSPPRDDDSGRSGRRLETLTHENDEPSRPAQPPVPQDLGSGPLAGAWVESFGSRAGCSDTVYIRQEGSELQVAGADCNDGERYAYEAPRFSGNTLSVRATVPSSGYVIVYTLRQTRAGELKGKADVTGGGDKHTYDVTWTRNGTPPAPARQAVARPGLEGVWVESFGARPGCSDKIAIHQVGTTLLFSGADCNSGNPYVYSEPTFNGIVLTVKATVPANKYVIRYNLRQTHPGELKGRAEVTGAGNTNSYDVTWTRQE